jgi:exosortase F-associated protein
MHIIKYLGVALLILALVAVRFFENELFADPLIDFFKGNFLQKPRANYDLGEVLYPTLLRYLLNSLLSIGVLVLLFKRRAVRLFAIVFYAFALFPLIGLFIYYYENLGPDTYMSFFYIRRFLIQPLFLLLLVPAFYYQQKHTKIE